MLDYVRLCYLLTHPAWCLTFHPVAPFVKYIHKNVFGPCDRQVLNNVLLNVFLLCSASAVASGTGISCLCKKVGALTVPGIIPE